MLCCVQLLYQTKGLFIVEASGWRAYVCMVKEKSSAVLSHLRRSETHAFQASRLHFHPGCACHVNRSIIVIYVKRTFAALCVDGKDLLRVFFTIVCISVTRFNLNFHVPVKSPSGQASFRIFGIGNGVKTRRNEFQISAIHL